MTDEKENNISNEKNIEINEKYSNLSDPHFLLKTLDQVLLKTLDKFENTSEENTSEEDNDEVLIKDERHYHTLDVPVKPLHLEDFYDEDDHMYHYKKRIVFGVFSEHENFYLWYDILQCGGSPTPLSLAINEKLKDEKYEYDFSQEFGAEIGNSSNSFDILKKLEFGKYDYEIYPDKFAKAATKKKKIDKL